MQKKNSNDNDFAAQTTGEVGGRTALGRPAFPPRRQGRSLVLEFPRQQILVVLTLSRYL